MMRGLLVGSLLMLLWPGTAHAACHARFSFTFGGTSSGTMSTSSGAQCSANAGRTGANTVIKSVKIVSPPQNGTASAGAHGVTYRSRPGYKGGDSFTFSFFGDGNAGKNLTATVQMSVTVQ
jgi:hypothetical protein